MNKTETIDPITQFLEHFKIVAETSAFHEVTYNPETKTYGSDEPSINDSANAITVHDRRAEDDESIDELVLFVHDSEEIELIEALSELFADVGQDLDAFIEKVKEEYR